MKAILNKQLLFVTKGEILRAYKYKILTIGISVSFIWLIILFFLRKNIQDLEMIVPLLIFTDAALMSVILIGASIFFEKQEGSVRSLLVTPVSIGQILIAKIISSTLIGIISALVVGIGAIIMTDISINIPLLLVYVILTVVAHSAIGFALTIISKDFNSMLINFMVFTIVFIIPPILVMFNIIPPKYELIALLSPSQASNILISSTIEGMNYKWYKILLSIVYLLVISILIMRFFVYKRFVKDAMRG